MIGLPYEIWQHISSFLSTEEAWALYGLNHTLRNIALEIRYRCVKANFAPRNYASYVRRFRHLSDDRISGRVRELHLLPYVSLDPFDFPGDQTNYQPPSEIESTQPDNDTMLNTIARFTNLSHLRIVSTNDNCGESLNQGLPLMTGTLQTFSNHLQSLVLFFPLHIFSSIDFANIIFSRLESLEIGFPNLEVLSTPALDPVIMKLLETDAKRSMLPFINRHCHTLRSLTLCLSQSQQAFIPFIPLPNPTATNLIIDNIFEGITYIPNLGTASFNTPTKLPSHHAIYRFLARHAKTLRSLNICMANMSVFDLHGFMDGVEMPMPHLESLTLDLGFRSRSRIADPSPAKFIRQYASSLRTLKLDKKQHGKGEIFSIFEMTPGDLTIYSKLLYLEIWVYCLTPDILDLFSASLPNLEDLDLSLRLYKGGNASIKNERSQFCLEMKSRQYSDWRLKHLTLQSFGSPKKVVANVDCISAVVASLPHLLSINEVSRVEYLPYLLGTAKVRANITYVET